MRGLLNSPRPKGSSERGLGKVDVVVLTKNSQEQLERSLNAVYRNVPVNRLIAVDGYSTDRTLEILNKFNRKYRNVLLIQDKGLRGKARQIGIDNVETEWFMFVDSDAELCAKWFEKAKALITPKVGAIWGIEVWSVIKNPRILRLFLQVTMNIFKIRGGTHDLLVRRNAVKGIRIPSDLHSFEDAFIKEWISKKGFMIIAAYNPYCIHHRPSMVWSLKSGIKIAQSELRCGLLHKYPSLLLSYGFYVAYFMFQSLRKASLPMLQLVEPQKNT